MFPWQVLGTREAGPAALGEEDTAEPGAGWAAGAGETRRRERRLRALSIFVAGGSASEVGERENLSFDDLCEVVRLIAFTGSLS